MVVFPPCKINLGLSIVSKRFDGYHNLETCFFPVPWYDVLEVIESNTFNFVSTGIAIPGSSHDNLCVKAYNLLKQDYQLPEVTIHLHKVIPTGAGLGGGSSDAAYMLRMLNDKFELNLSQDILANYAARLGSDCAFFVYDGPMMGSGRGEILRPVDLPLANKFLAIVKPSVHVSTADAFAGISPQPMNGTVEDIVTKTPLTQWRDQLKNDFENTVFKKYPEIEQVKEKLYAMGGLYASLSGSGSAVFGLFDNQVDLQGAFPGLTTWGKIL